jgi:hypothetical protein
MNTSSQVSLKIFNNDEIRRLTINQPYPSWPDFYKGVASLFNLTTPFESFKIYYEDDEKDKITVNSELEWQATLPILKLQPIYKIYLQESLLTPETSTTSTSTLPHSKNDNDTEMKTDESSDSAKPQPFFPPHWGPPHRGWGGRPKCDSRMGEFLKNRHNNWLNNCMNYNNNNDNARPFPFPFKHPHHPHPHPHAHPHHEFRGGMCDPLRIHKRDFKMKLKHAHKGKKLEKKMHKRALRELKIQNYTVASKLLEALISLNPTNYTAFYNLACCDALSGSPDSALTHLSLAVENGFQDEHLLQTDADLTSIREHPQFKEIAKNVTDKSQVEPFSAPLEDDFEILQNE